MSDTTTIEWTESTWNIITGCSVKSRGCKRCYAMKLAGTRLQNHPSRAGLTTITSAGPVWNGEVRFNREWLEQPIGWRRPRNIFVCAHGDLFHEAVPDEWIDQAFAVMALAPWHTFQVLTKRAERMRSYLSHPQRRARITAAARAIADASRHPISLLDALAWPLPNVWLGVSVEDQKRADERIPALLMSPAAVRYISAEPLLGPVDLESIRWPGLDGHRVDVLRGGYWNEAPYVIGAKSAELGAPKGGFTNHSDFPSTLDWVIVGGESGRDARPMHPRWARQLRDQCAAAGVDFFFKQWGQWIPICQIDSDWLGSLYRPRVKAKQGEDQDVLNDLWGRVCKVPELCLHIDGYHAKIGQASAFQAGTDPIHAFSVGKKVAGRLLDGQLHDGMPARRVTPNRPNQLVAA
ncbi:MULTISPECIES: phage Gp37/Gp68 family protein [unclassified Burkholderia]|uniref:DUF5131 family protein n=1 Tax=unclassified Burkholderia TaxID=2613784 RepID=UPI002AB143BA|nr:MULTISPECIES: phage Gp37/Gp68 family protein [unclassified Burkholderia]